MRYFSFVQKIAILLSGVALSFVVLLAIQIAYPVPKTNVEDAGIALRMPSFLNTKKAMAAEEIDLDLLLKDAGIIAYVKLSKEIDLVNFSASYFMLPSQETEEYTSGVANRLGDVALKMQDAPEIHLVVHRTGWLVAYLTRFQQASALFDWVNYDSDKKTITSLERVINQVAQDAGESLIPGSVAYYDLRNTDATNIFLVGDSTDLNRGENTFSLLIPKSVTVYDFSWSHAVVMKDNARPPSSRCKLQDNDTITSQLNTNTDNPWRLALQSIPEEDFQILIVKAMTFALTLENYEGRSYCGVAIVYSEPVQ